MADMLSRARFEDLPIEEDEEEMEEGFFVNVVETSQLQDPNFREKEYEGDIHRIGKFLQENYHRPTWLRDIYKHHQKEASKFFLKDGYIWKRPRKASGTPARVLGTKDSMRK